MAGDVAIYQSSNEVCLINHRDNKALAHSLHYVTM